MSVISISAAIIDYDDDWTGRYLVQDVTVFTLSAMPSIAYRVNDKLSLGAGAMVMFAALDEKLAAPPPRGTGQVKIDGNDFEFGLNLSALYEFDDDTRLGLMYSSEMTPTFSGDVEITPPDLQAGIDAGIVFPQLVRLSGYHQLNPRWALLGTVGWENWSAFENITLSTAKGSQVLPRNWDDTWHYSAGAHYRINNQWLLQFGAAYDTSPVRRLGQDAGHAHGPTGPVVRRCSVPCEQGLDHRRRVYVRRITAMPRSTTTCSKGTTRRTTYTF